MAKNTNTDLLKGYCLITGAAGGLGFELAKLFAEKGYSLVMIDKDAENLSKAVQLVKSEFGIEIVSINENLTQLVNSKA